MKKKILSLLAVVCFVFSLSVSTASAKHFDYNEAYQILQGKWVDTTTGQEFILVWKSKDGSECNITPNVGNTDPKGTSEIYFDNKGIFSKIQVTYYADQDQYYGRLIKVNPNTGRMVVLNECLMRE